MEDLIKQADAEALREQQTFQTRPSAQQSNSSQQNGEAGNVDLPKGDVTSRASISSAQDAQVTRWILSSLVTSAVAMALCFFWLDNLSFLLAAAVISSFILACANGTPIDVAHEHLKVTTLIKPRFCDGVDNLGQS